MQWRCVELQFQTLAMKNMGGLPLSIFFLSLFCNMIALTAGRGAHPRHYRSASRHTREDAKLVQVQLLPDGDAQEWNSEVSLQLFEHRKLHGPPLTSRDRIHEIQLRKDVYREYKKRKAESERQIEEAKKPRKPHPLLCNSHSCIVAGLKVHYEHQRGLFFCRDCPNPALEGSWLDIWECHYNKAGQIAGAPLVFAVPNDGSAAIMNDEDVRGRVALMRRGGVALNTKIRYAQEAGAIAAIIINSKCERKVDGLRCEAEMKERAYGHGFAISDAPNHWSDIRIPSMIISEADGKRIVGMMDLDSMEINGHGIQYFDKHLNKS